MAPHDHDARSRQFAGELRLFGEDFPHSELSFRTVLGKRLVIEFSPRHTALILACQLAILHDDLRYRRGLVSSKQFGRRSRDWLRKRIASITKREPIQEDNVSRYRTSIQNAVRQLVTARYPGDRAELFDARMGMKMRTWRLVVRNASERFDALAAAPDRELGL